MHSLELVSDRDSLLHSIAVFEEVVQSDPANIEAWAKLANLYILKGAAFEKRAGAKRKAYEHAMSLCESAMMNDPDFGARISKGDPVWEAASGLGADYVAPISFWSTALFYQFDECLNKIVKPMNLRWIQRAEIMLGYAYAIEPDWGGGQLHFSYGIYYLMPKVAGGDLEKSQAYFDKAVEVGPDWLLNRWGRARYLYKRTGNTDGQIADFKWVLNQDPALMKGPLYWNLFIQQDARKILDKKGVTP